MNILDVCGPFGFAHLCCKQSMPLLQLESGHKQQVKNVCRCSLLPSLAHITFCCLVKLSFTVLLSVTVKWLIFLYQCTLHIDEIKGGRKRCVYIYIYSEILERIKNRQELVYTYIKK